MRTDAKHLMTVFLLLSMIILTSGWAYAAPLYFPHVAASDPWQTEIAFINTGGQTVSGTLRTFSNTGVAGETQPVTLPAHGRKQINVAAGFANHADIGYMVFETDSDVVQGYAKFYREAIYRAAVPAVKEVNTSLIPVPHIASNAQWRTELSLLNTTSETKKMYIDFHDFKTGPQITLHANEHRVFDIASLQPPSDLESATIVNGGGIIGLALFSSTDGDQMDGILLTDKAASTLYFPHVADDNWWTGIAAYNTTSPCTVTVMPYSTEGAPLASSTLSLPMFGKYGGEVSELGLPEGTSWFRMESTNPLTGFELFSPIDNQQLAPYAGEAGTSAKYGIFPKIEKNGWTGIAFVNTAESQASVTLKAYDDNGTAVAESVLDVAAHAKEARAAEAFFTQDIGSATYIAYASNRNIVGFQINGSSDRTMLDGLAALPAPAGVEVPGEGVKSDKERNTSPQVPQENLSALIDGNTSFALDLYHFLANEKKDKNRFLSPYSISLCFAMAYGGARDNTEAQMKDVFHYTLDQDQLHPAFNALSLDLASREQDYDGDGKKDFQLNIANAMWGQTGYTFLPTYLDLLAENYGAGIGLLDLRHEREHSAEVINGWIHEETNGLIDGGVTPNDFNDYSLFVLANAIYFKAKWMDEFDESSTHDDTFYAPSGNVTVPMMNQWAYVNYAEGADYQGAEIPYKGNTAGMLVLLPKEGKFDEFEASLTRERLSGIIEGLDNREVVLKLPKFDYKPDLIDLKDVLSQMGMTDPFAFPDADFSGMDGIPHWIYLQFARHLAFVSVDERGTEAAAVTVIGAGGGGYPEEPQTKFIVNRPFIFLIRDRVTGTILFMGRILDPSKTEG
jgi:serpin B